MNLSSITNPPNRSIHPDVVSPSRQGLLNQIIMTPEKQRRGNFIKKIERWDSQLLLLNDTQRSRSIDEFSILIHQEIKTLIEQEDPHHPLNWAKILIKISGETTLPYNTTLEDLVSNKPHLNIHTERSYQRFLAGLSTAGRIVFDFLAENQPRPPQFNSAVAIAYPIELTHTESSTPYLSALDKDMTDTQSTSSSSSNSPYDVSTFIEMQPSAPPMTPEILKQYQETLARSELRWVIPTRQLPESEFITQLKMSHSKTASSQEKKACEQFFKNITYDYERHAALIKKDVHLQLIALVQDTNSDTQLRAAAGSYLAILQRSFLESLPLGEPGGYDDVLNLLKTAQKSEADPHIDSREIAHILAGFTFINKENKVLIVKDLSDILQDIKTPAEVSQKIIVTLDYFFQSEWAGSIEAAPPAGFFTALITFRALDLLQRFTDTVPHRLQLAREKIPQGLSTLLRDAQPLKSDPYDSYRTSLITLLGTLVIYPETQNAIMLSGGYTEIISRLKEPKRTEAEYGETQLVWKSRESLSAFAKVSHEIKKAIQIELLDIFLKSTTPPNVKKRMNDILNYAESGIGSDLPFEIYPLLLKTLKAPNSSSEDNHYALDLLMTLSTNKAHQVHMVQAGLPIEFQNFLQHPDETIRAKAGALLGNLVTHPDIQQDMLATVGHNWIIKLIRDDSGEKIWLRCDIYAHIIDQFSEINIETKNHLHTQLLEIVHSLDSPKNLKQRVSSVVTAIHYTHSSNIIPSPYDSKLWMSTCPLWIDYFQDPHATPADQKYSLLMFNWFAKNPENRLAMYQLGVLHLVLKAQKDEGWIDKVYRSGAPGYMGGAEDTEMLQRISDHPQVKESLIHLQNYALILALADSNYKYQHQRLDKSPIGQLLPSFAQANPDMKDTLIRDILKRTDASNKILWVNILHQVVFQKPESTLTLSSKDHALLTEISLIRDPNTNTHTSATALLNTLRLAASR